MIHEPLPCVVWIPADGLAIVGRELESRQVIVGGRMSVATVSVQDRESDE